jgi:glutamine synthetase
VAEALNELNLALEAEEGRGTPHREAVMAVVRQAVVETKAIRFEGNGYSEEWKREAERRGLPHAKDTVAALKIWEGEAAKAAFVQTGVLTREELEARIHIRHEQYQKALSIEAQVLREMAETQILPTVLADLGARAGALNKLAAAGLEVPESLKTSLQAQAHLAGEAQTRLLGLVKALADAEGLEHHEARTEAFGHSVRVAMEALRDVLDTLEEGCNAEFWPLPKYRDLLAPLL